MRRSLAKVRDESFGDRVEISDGGLGRAGGGGIGGSQGFKL